MTDKNQQWQDKIFPHLRPLRTSELSTPEYRINLITDSINKGSLYGGVATAIILATLLAEKNNYQLRIITRTEKAIEENIQIILKTNKINFDGYIEFIFADIHNHNWTIDNSPTDYYLTTSWWTTASTLKGLFPHQIIYLLQEDERMFYPHGDDHYQCSRILANSEIQFIVNSELLFQSLINSGLDNIKNSGMFFEPSFVPHYHQTNQKNDCKKKFFFYGRPNNLRNLFYLGLEVIEKAVLNNILSTDEWDIYFIGKDLHLLKEQNISLPFNPIILENLNFPEYIDFIGDVDLGLSLMYTPHPSYPPLDLAASGAVVVTNKFGLKNDLSNYSQNIICKNLSVDDLVEGIAEAIKIIEDEHLRHSNFDRNSLQKDWHHSFKNILDKLILQKVDMDYQLKETQLELGKTKNELRAIKSQLYETQSQLGETELKLQENKLQLEETELKLQENKLQLEETQSHLTKQLNNSQIQLEIAENTIVAMETSKFWKLRKKWFKLKYLIKTSLLLISTYGLNNTLRFLQFLPKEDEIPSSDNGDYQKWLENNYPRRKDLISMAVNIKNIDHKPIISLILPTYNTPENFLIEAIESVLNQVYPYWELCIADDCSNQPHVTRILRRYTRKDKRIKAIYRDTNGHISLASNSALEIATGEYIALFDHDDLLTPHALYEVVSLLNQHPEADFIYTDEDKVDENNILKEAFFKPDWCPDSFLSRMYTCHLGVYRRWIINEIGGFRVGFEGSQDYDLVLRFTEKTDKIFHIPNILYHWRIHSESTAGDANAKNYAYDAAQKAITEAITRRGENGTVIKNEQFLGVYKIRYQIKEPKLVSIIIPTKDLGKLLHQCLESIFTKTTYPNYEVIVIDNGSVESETFACFDYWGTKEPNRFSYYTYDIPFNYSKLNNYGVEKAKGDYLLFLNNDTEVISEDWLQAMVEQAQRKSIGIVGCLLLYPDNTIQHAGVVLGPPGGMAGHGHKFLPSTDGGYFGQLVSINNYSTVTGACMMCRRDVFMEVNGFEEYLEVACNDIDLCLKIVERGYRNIYLPHVRLYHHESKTRGIDNTPEKKLRSYKELKYMWAKWQNLIDNDPCYNPNLTRKKEDYSINLELVKYLKNE